MTEVTTTLQSAYLAGPMRGYDEFNFPAFHREAAWLRSKGWKIFSPAERDEADPVLNGDWAVKAPSGPKTHDGRGLDYFMQYDLAAVCQTDAVILMKGWQASQGARLEAMVAIELGHPVFEIKRLGLGQHKGLAYVEPRWIGSMFYAHAIATKTPEVVS